MYEIDWLLSTIDIMNSDELKQGVFDGYLVFVINDYVLNTLESMDFLYYTLFEV